MVQLDRRRLPDALKSFSAARDTLAQLAPRNPAVAFELADAHGWIAKTREAAGDYAGTIEAQQARRQVLSAIPDATKNARIARQLANVTFELARMHLNLGELTLAESDARDALARMLALVAAGRLETRVALTVPWTDIAQALDALRQRSFSATTRAVILP